MSSLLVAISVDRPRPLVDDSVSPLIDELWLESTSSSATRTDPGSGEGGGRLCCKSYVGRRKGVFAGEGRSSSSAMRRFAPKEVKKALGSVLALLCLQNSSIDLEW